MASCPRRRSVGLLRGAYFFIVGFIMPPNFSQVPLATYFQSPGSLSLVDQEAENR